MYRLENYTMTTKASVSLFLLLFLMLTSRAQEAGNLLYNINDRIKYQVQEAIKKATYPNSNIVHIDVSGLYNAEADAYLAIFHLTQVGKSVKEADSLINSRINAFKIAAMDAGINAEDFHTDFLSMVPVYETEVTKKMFSKLYNEVPVGIEVQKNIHVRYYKASNLDKIITAAAFQEIYDLIKVEYFVNNIEDIYAELRTQAIELVKVRIEEYDNLGIAVKGQWRQVSDLKSVNYPIERYQSFTTTSRPSIQAMRKKDLLAQEPPKNTLFYNMLPANNYDFVMNASMVGPVVQYSYNLQLQVTLERKPEKAPEPVVKTEIKHKYFFVTPTGEVKELPAN